MCPACGEEFDTGTILMDKRLRQTLERKTCTHWLLCPTHAKQIDAGYILLVGADPDKSTISENQTIKPDGAYRTGEIAAVQGHLWDDLLGVPRPLKSFVYCEPEVIKQIRACMNANTINSDTEDG